MRLDYAVVVSSVSSFPTAHCSSRSLFVLQIGLTCLSLCLSLFQTTTTTQTTTQKRKQKQAKPANAAMLQLIVGFLVGAVFVSIFSGSGSNYSVRCFLVFSFRERAFFLLINNKTLLLFVDLLQRPQKSSKARTSSLKPRRIIFWTTNCTAC